MGVLVNILFCLVCVSFVRGLHLPSYITACKIDDPNFEKCAIKNANAAIPTLVKGDKKYDIPPLNPLLIPSLNFTLFGTFNVFATDMVVEGLPNLQLQRFETSKSKELFTLQGYIPKSAIIKSKYKVNGKLLSFDLGGNGDLHMNFDDAIIRFELNLSQVKRNGKTYLKIEKSKATVTPKQFGMHLTNLFGSDPSVEKQMDKFLNDNSNDVLKELGPTLDEVIGTVVRRVVSKILQEIPVDEIFINYFK